MKCLNTNCNNLAGVGVLVGIKLEFCPACEEVAQRRVMAYRKINARREK